MKKRVISALLWFYAGWTFGAMIASVFALNAALGPLIGVVAAALLVGDPRRIIWASRAVSPVEGRRPDVA